MKFCRLDLSQTNYQLYPNAELWMWVSGIAPFEKIYQDYCRYKQFVSVMPLFLSQFQDAANDIHVYFDQGQLVAWSLCHRYDDTSVESLQFAWNYANPQLELGLKSLEHECAFYKQRGYRYLYLGETANYKAQFDGYEILGPI